MDHTTILQPEPGDGVGHIIATRVVKYHSTLREDEAVAGFSASILYNSSPAMVVATDWARI